MIGLSICEDAIRAVRVKKTGNKYIIKDHAAADLYEHVIINGNLVDEQNFITALEEIKDVMAISPDENIHVGLPSALFKIGSTCMQAEDYSSETLIEKINLDKAFEVRPFFISGSYKVETELFERYGLSQEEIEQLVEKQLNEQNGWEETKPPFTMVKTISYVAILKKNLELYLEAFKKCGLQVYTIEPNALAYINYLRKDALQPFMIPDVDMDYTSFIIFGEKTGAFMLNGVDLGIENIEIQDETKAEPVINKGAVDKFIGKSCLAMDFFKNDSVTKKEEVQQIIFLSNYVDYLIDEAEKVLVDQDIAVAEELLPSILSEKGMQKIPPDEWQLYYLPVVLASNKDMEFDIHENVEKNIETNFLSPEERQTLAFKETKSIITKVAYTTAAAASLYFAAIMGTNLFNMFQAGYFQDTPTEIVSKYEEAKTQGDILKDNIAKYNAIAKAKIPITPIIDSAISVKPNDVYMTNLNISGRTINTRRLVIECITEHADSASKFVDNLVQLQGLEKARILSQQVKNGKIAVQIVAPLTGNTDVKTEKPEKNDSKSNKK